MKYLIMEAHSLKGRLLIHGCTVLNTFQDGAHSIERLSLEPFPEKAASLTVATKPKSFHSPVLFLGLLTPVKKPEPLLLILSFKTITYTICLGVIGSLSNLLRTSSHT